MLRVPRLAHVPTHLAPAVPALALFLAIYVPSLVLLLALSLYTHVPGEQPIPRLTLENYGRFLSDPYYIGLMARTFYLSAVASIVAVVLALPIARAVIRSARMRRLIVPVLAVSFFVSAILRLYGWIGVLGGGGVINGTLLQLGVISSPIGILYTDASVIIGLADYAVPYAVLTLVGSFGAVDQSLEEAAQNLGATQWQTHLRITTPLVLPGLAAAFLLAFVLSVSAVLTPIILGGGRVPMLATQVYDSMIVAVNYPFASATVVIILAVVSTMIFLMRKALRVSG